MFKLTMASALLKSIITCLKEFVDSAEFVIDPTGIHVNTLDEANVCLLRFFISKQELIAFEVLETSKAFVTLDTLDKVLKSAKKEVNLSKKDDSNLYISYKAASRNMEYSIPIQNISKDVINPPKTELFTSFNLESSTLGDICSELKAINESCFIIIDNNKIIFNAKDKVMGEANIALDNVESLEISADSKNSEQHIIQFSTSYFAKMCKIAKKTKNTLIEIPKKQQEPLNFTFSTENGTQLEFLLATKV